LADFIGDFIGDPLSAAALVSFTGDFFTSDLSSRFSGERPFVGIPAFLAYCLVALFGGLAFGDSAFFCPPADFLPPFCAGRDLFSGVPSLFGDLL
jgi:hypothetical protein